jgi:hypothetical protein
VPELTDDKMATDAKTMFDTKVKTMFDMKVRRRRAVNWNPESGFRQDAVMSQTTAAPGAPFLTTPAVARELAVDEWKLRRTLERGYLQPPVKIGSVFLWRRDDLVRVRAALVEAGYVEADDLLVADERRHADDLQVADELLKEKQP